MGELLAFIVVITLIFVAVVVVITVKITNVFVVAAASVFVFGAAGMFVEDMYFFPFELEVSLSNLFLFWLSIQ